MPAVESEPLIHRATTLLEAQLDAEIVALDPEQGSCFGFNSTATRVWQMLEHPCTRNQLRDALLREFDVEPALCEAQLAELLGEMRDHGLIRVDADAP